MILCFSDDATVTSRSLTICLSWIKCGEGLNYLRRACAGTPRLYSKRRCHVPSFSTANASAASPQAHSSTTPPFKHHIQHNMNSFVERFSATSSAAELRKAREIYGDDEDGAGVMWGSEAGFGNVASGVPRFNIPAVADVCIDLYTLWYLY